MANAYDYRVFIDKIAKVVKDASGGKPLIESNSAGKQPPFPFCTYTITSPYISITQDVLEEEEFEMVVSFTWHGESGLDMLNLAAQTNKYLRSAACSEYLTKHQIVVVQVSNSGKRDNFLTVDYERMAGFDVRFRVKDTYADGTKDTIEQINFTNETIY